MQTSQFDYTLPKELIAQQPAEPRESARLMVVDRKKKTITHTTIGDLPTYLGENDLLVRNNSKVFKARLFGHLVSGKSEALREHTKPVEIFLIRPMANDGVWKALARPGRHVESGMRIVFAHDFYADVVVKEKDGTILVQFQGSPEEVRALANRYGHVPVPPYVKGEDILLSTYQTTYARDDKEGSVAAPTAGFHFTATLEEQLQAKGVSFAEITLHVGLGTFLPVKSEHIEEHVMHSEWIEIETSAADAMNKAKAEGKRLLAVGTTTVRTLEGLTHMVGFHDKKIDPYTGDINIFITPGFAFNIVDALMTNFHLPKSTLLMLVAAFIGDTDFTLECYQKAVEERYRFYSFGDAMLIV